MSKSFGLGVCTSLLATGALVAGVLAAAPAEAATSSAETGAATPHAVTHRHFAAARLKSDFAKHSNLTAKQGAAIRAKQRAKAASMRAAVRPHATAAAATFTVNTTTDVDLATATSTTCVDTNNTCSLRAAVDAANNIKQPVTIVLPAGTYQLTMGQLSVTNPGDTTIAGAGSTTSIIEGDSDRIVEVGAATSSSAAALTITGAELTAGSTTSDGGAIYLDDSPGAALVLANDLLTNNTATGSGGAINASGEDTIYASNVAFTSNLAAAGGAINTNASDVHLVNATITGNTGSEAAGAINDNASVYDFAGGSISGNTAGTATVQGNGGAVFAATSDFELSGTTVDGNKTLDGGIGGAFALANFATLDVTGGSISNDISSGPLAGGIAAEGGSEIGVHGVTMTGDTVTDTSSNPGGGAIYVLGVEATNALTIDSGSKITGANAGAIYTVGAGGGVDMVIDDSTLSDNVDTTDNGCGGAVCDFTPADGGSSLSMSRDTVTGNSGFGDGGAGAVWAFADQNAGVSVTLTGNVFSGNTVGAGGAGGAVGVLSEDDGNSMVVRSSSNVFKNNVSGSAASPGAGGGMGVDNEVPAGAIAFSDTNSVFSGNQALGQNGEGGGLINYGVATTRLTGTQFLNNSAGTGTTDGIGGGASIYSFVSSQLDHVVFSGNSAGTIGGGLASGGPVAITRSTISGNVAGSGAASGQGGGLALDGGARLVESTIAGNRVTSIGSPGEGGGVWTDDAQLDVRYSTISTNVADSGGGIFADADAGGGSLLASIVSNNKAQSGVAQDCTMSVPAAYLNSLGGNVIGAGCVGAASVGDTGTDSPGLRALASNGGPTKTMALVKTSPAVKSGTQFCDATDQRGEPRPATGCSAGAYQYAAASISSLSPKKGKAGTKVTIHGSGFDFLSKVVFGKKKAKILSATATKIVVKAPTGPTGLKKKAKKVTVKAYSPNGYSKVGHFTYNKIKTKKKKK